MIGDGYWATGIVVTYSGGGQHGWAAEVGYYDAGFCNDDPDTGQISTEGTLHTRYHVRRHGPGTADPLKAVIDVIKADAERLGIRFNDDACVFYKGDGEAKDYPPPEGWRELVDAQAVRLGWRGIYGTRPSPLVAAVDSTEEGQQP